MEMYLRNKYTYNIFQLLTPKSARRRVMITLNDTVTLFHVRPCVIFINLTNNVFSIYLAQNALSSLVSVNWNETLP